MKRTWPARLGTMVVGLILAAGGCAAYALWLGNRSVAPVSLADRQQAYQRAVSWVRNHEALILKDQNTALWWMIQAAAERTADPYLAGLMERYKAVASQDGVTRLPWWRMMEPSAAVDPDVVPVQSLEPYQQFLHHALTCQPVVHDTVDTRLFLNKDACRPAFTRVLLQDPACTTHQLMGVLLMDRAACTTPSVPASLKSELLRDIEQQMGWDVIVKDAYLQRLMMLMWRGQPDQVKAIWLRRVLSAQQSDGGWMGARQIPELPAWAQPSAFRTQLAAWWPSRFQAGAGSDFHATAQGLLITALAITEPGK